MEKNKELAKTVFDRMCIKLGRQTHVKRMHASPIYKQLRETLKERDGFLELIATADKIDTTVIQNLQKTIQRYKALTQKRKEHEKPYRPTINALSRIIRGLEAKAERIAIEIIGQEPKPITDVPHEYLDYVTTKKKKAKKTKK